VLEVGRPESWENVTGSWRHWSSAKHHSSNLFCKANVATIVLFVK
jgi:hypothetical protein